MRYNNSLVLFYGRPIRRILRVLSVGPSVCLSVPHKLLIRKTQNSQNWCAGSSGYG